MNLFDQMLLKLVNVSTVARSMVSSIEGLSIDVADLTQTLIQVIREQRYQQQLIAELAARSGIVIKPLPTEPSSPKDKPN